MEEAGVKKGWQALTLSLTELHQEVKGNIDFFVLFSKRIV